MITMNWSEKFKFYLVTNEFLSMLPKSSVETRSVDRYYENFWRSIGEEAGPNIENDDLVWHRCLKFNQSVLYSYDILKMTYSRYA